MISLPGPFVIGGGASTFREAMFAAMPNKTAEFARNPKLFMQTYRMRNHLAIDSLTCRKSRCTSPSSAAGVMASGRPL